MPGKRIKEYFTFTKKERNGIIVLLFLLIILIIVNQYLNFSSNENIVLMDDESKKQIEQFENSLKEKARDVKKVKNQYISTNNDYQKSDSWFIPDSLFPFDPNTVSKKELQKLGFANFQIHTLIKYRNAGGHFYTNEDLLKVYGIEESQFNQLKSYISIIDKYEKKDNEQKKENSRKNENADLMIEINSSTKDSLMKIKGIGPYFAERIIKYRDLLGGFVSKKQLFEVYGLDSALVNSIGHQIEIDSSLINKINLNQVEYKELIRHPYINKYQTQSLIKFRELKGKFNSIEEIDEHNLLPYETFRKVKPYLEN